MRERMRAMERERGRERASHLMPPSNVSDTLLASQVSDTALGCMYNDQLTIMSSQILLHKVLQSLHNLCVHNITMDIMLA